MTVRKPLQLNGKVRGPKIGVLSSSSSKGIAYARRQLRSKQNVHGLLKELDLPRRGIKHTILNPNAPFK
ncbi:MAG TPA: hypothetical protein VJH23_06645 [archaeon]|nr:hypothetical protein [archaeon]